MTCVKLAIVSNMEGAVRNSLKVEYLHNHCTDSSKSPIKMMLVIVVTKYILLFGSPTHPLEIIWWCVFSLTFSMDKKSRMTFSKVVTPRPPWHLKHFS